MTIESITGERNRVSDEMIVNFRDVLLRTQSTSRETVLANQDALLQKLLLHAKANVPHYRKTIPQHALARPRDTWSTLPLIQRSDLQDDFDSFRARTIPPYCGKVQEGLTSGSTGRPIRYLHDALMDVGSAGQTDRFFSLWRLDGEKTFGTFMSTFDDPRRRDMRRYGWRAGRPGGVREILELSNDTDAQIDWLKTVRVDYLMARGGGHIEELAWRALERNERLRFKRLLSSGSPVPDRARSIARKAFRCDVQDCYGASETGMIAYQCPDCGLYHCCDETMLVEVLDPEGAPCADGETGRVVVTSFYGYAMPLIRYEIGDYATSGPDRAPCGKPYASLRAIAGRYRNAFVLRDGRTVHLYAQATRLRPFLSYRQIQLVQTDWDVVEVRYVADDENAIPDRDGIQSLMRRSMPDVAIEIRRVAEIKVDPSGKYEETLCLVPRDGQTRRSDQKL